MESEQERDQLKAQVAEAARRQHMSDLNYDALEKQVAVLGAEHEELGLWRRGLLVNNSKITNDLTRQLDQARALLILTYNPFSDWSEQIREFAAQGERFTDTDLAWARAVLDKEKKP